MLSKSIENLLNRQIEREIYSSNLYLAMASFAEIKGFDGISKWLYAQSEEERLHMLKIMAFVNERGGEAIVTAVPQPPRDFANPLEMFKQVLQHEEFITQSIHEIVTLCTEERDYTTGNWIQWFVAEQIQEEKSVRIIIDKLKMVGEQNLYQFDRDIMALRSAAEPAVN